jgi:lipid-A-disaccharide synthase
LKQKIFLITGEISGDKLASWYLKKKNITTKHYHIEAVGGEFLKESGAQLYKNILDMSVVGFFEILHKIPYLVVTLYKLASYIINKNFNQVVIVDFPGFNMYLAKILKKRKDSINITYFAPPQVWCWGTWRIKKLQRYCNKLIVLYPFEVDFYKKYEINVEWLGSPIFERIKNFVRLEKPRKNIVAILIGSRTQEIKALSPFIKKTMMALVQQGFKGSFLIPVATKSLQNLTKCCLSIHQNPHLAKKTMFITDEQEKYLQLSSCCLAISKPGTITLELALMGIPTILFYKTNHFTYFFAKQLVSIEHMALPNLLCDKPLYKEFIQYDCTVNNICREFWRIYLMFLSQHHDYHNEVKKLASIKKVLEIT